LETTRDKYEAMWAKQPASLALGEEVRQFHAAHNAEVDKIADERAVDDRLFLDARAADNKRFDDKQADDRKRLDERQTDERRALVRERFDKQFADREKDVAPKQGGVEKAPEVQAKRPEPAQQLPGIGPERSEQARVRQDSLAPSLGTYSRGSIMGAESRNHGFEVSQQELKNQKCEAEQRNDWGAAKIYDLQHQQNAAAFNRDVMGDVAAKQYCCHGDNADYREYIKESRESGVRADQLALEISQERDRQARGIIPQPLDQLQGRQASVKQAPVADREAPQAKQTPPRVQAGAQQEQPKQTVSKEQRRPQQVQGEVPQVSKPRQATPFSFKATADRAAERTSEQSATLAQGIGQRKPEQAQVERPLSDQAAVAFAKLTFPADEPHQNSGTERAASGQSSQQTSPSQQASKPRQTTPFSFQATAARSAENTAEQAVSQVHGAGQRRPPQVQGAVQI
jgi:hypothetical protein